MTDKNLFPQNWCKINLQLFIENYFTNFYFTIYTETKRWKTVDAKTSNFCMKKLWLAIKKQSS